MLSNWWLNSFTAVTVLLEISALLLIARARAAHRWPSLTASLSLDLATSATCSALLGHSYSAYFYVYWISAGIQAVLQLGIFLDVARSFQRFDQIPSGVWTFCCVFALFPATAIASYSFHTSPSLGEFTQAVVLLLNRGVCIVWLGLLAGLLFTVKLIGFAWADDGVFVTWSTVLRLSSAAIAAEAYIHTPHWVRLAANGVDSACTIASTGLLCVTFFLSHKYRDKPFPQPLLNPELEVVIENLLRIASERKRY